MLRIGCGVVSLQVVGAWVSLGCTNFQGTKFDVPCPQNASDVESVLGEMCANNPLCVAFSAEFEVSQSQRTVTDGCHLWSHYQPLARQSVGGPACFTTHGSGHDAEFWSMWPFLIEMGNSVTPTKCLTVKDQLTLGATVTMKDCDGQDGQLWYGFEGRLLPAFGIPDGTGDIVLGDIVLNPTDGKGDNLFEIGYYDQRHPNISRWFLTPLPYEETSIAMAGLQTGTLGQGFLQSEDIVSKERCLVTDMNNFDVWMRDGCHSFHTSDGDYHPGWTLRWAKEAHTLV
jgi:hypothetical protein